MSAFIVEHCLILSNWLKWMKSLEIKWNWSHLWMTFSIIFSKIFRKTMQKNTLGESYNTWLGLVMIIEDGFLKWDGQWLVLMHVFAILMILLRHLSFLITALRCFREIQSGLRVNELLYLIMMLLNSFLEKGNQTDISSDGISSRMLRFIH